ncbi:glycosyltransferase [Bacillus paranthracis]
MQPDVLAVHSSKAGLLGRLAGWSLGIPTIFTAHGWAFTEGVPP